MVLSFFIVYGFVYRHRLLSAHIHLTSFQRKCSRILPCSILVIFFFFFVYIRRERVLLLSHARIPIKIHESHQSCRLDLIVKLLFNFLFLGDFPLFLLFIWKESCQRRYMLQIINLVIIIIEIRWPNLVVEYWCL